MLVTVFAAAAGSADVTAPADLTNGVSAALTGSAAFLSVALAVAVLVMRPRPVRERVPVQVAGRSSVN